MKKFDLIALILVTGLVATFGCSTGGGTPDNISNLKQVRLSEAAKLNLKLADKLDGTEDHVVEHCYSCALGMKGEPELACNIEGYELHFCKSVCREHLQGNPEKLISSTKVPSQKSNQ